MRRFAAYLNVAPRLRGLRIVLAEVLEVADVDVRGGMGGGAQAIGKVVIADRGKLARSIPGIKDEQRNTAFFYCQLTKVETRNLTGNQSTQFPAVHGLVAEEPLERLAWGAGEGEVMPNPMAP